MTSCDALLASSATVDPDWLVDDVKTSDISVSFSLSVPASETLIDLAVDGVGIDQNVILLERVAATGKSCDFS